MTAPVDHDATFRASHVGAGEVSALFGLNPWLTEFELYHRKRGSIATPEFNARGPDGAPINARVHWGVKLEKLILAEAVERYGYDPVETGARISNGAGLGGHPDAIVFCPVRQCRVVLEIKTVDWMERKKWGDEPPSQYLIQPNTYAGLAKADAFDVIALVMGGNSDLERFQYDFRPALYAEAEKRVAKFWQDVADGNEPRPDYSRDGAALVESIGVPNDSVADLRDDLDAEQEAMEWRAARDRRYAAEGDEAHWRARLIERAGKSSTMLLPSFRVSCGETKGSAGKLITADMVGTYHGARKGYRRFDIKEVAA